MRGILAVASLIVLMMHALYSNSFAQGLRSGAKTPDGSVAEDWQMVGGGWSNSRYSSLSQINARTVNRLSAAWVAENFEEGGTSRVTPVVKDRVMYVTAGRHVYALNAKTGARIWTYRTIPDASQKQTVQPGTKLNISRRAPNAAPNSRGVALGQGMVFVGLRDGHVIALKQQTGALVWMQQTGAQPPKAGQIAATAPMYSNGIVYVGLSNGDANLIGRISALKADSGEIQWQRFSIPGRGEPGHETWPSFNDTWRSGGGGVWTDPAFDSELGIVYFTTGNAVPISAGDQRPGDNLYTSSVLALDMKTGELKWHYQLVHHDVFDADAGTPVILYDAQLKGKARKALAVLRADGYLFQFDRETGEPLVPMEERPVPQLKSQATSATQPFPIGAESMLMSCEDWQKERIPVGFDLACMWTPPAAPSPSSDPQNVLAPFPAIRALPTSYSPQTGLFYAYGYSMLHWPRRAPDPYFFEFAATVPGLKVYGELAAIDSRTGQVAWKKRISTMPQSGFPFYLSGGPLATAGNLVLRGSEDGSFDAYDASTGEEVWRFQTTMQGVSGTPASYEIDGEQYIALPIGTAVWAFKLGGAIGPVEVAAASVENGEFHGPILETTEIETTALKTWRFGSGTRYFVDEYAFNPYRAGVKSGSQVLFVNNGNMQHEFAALDGSWSTGPLRATQDIRLNFEKPGEYPYICRDHPWVYGQIIVAKGSPAQRDGTETADARAGRTLGIVQQAIKGKGQFSQHCAACHGDDLNGRGTAPALAGGPFATRWGGRTVKDFFDRIRLTMPQGSPASLDPETYLNIVAHILQVNEWTLGMRPLEDNADVLKSIGMGRSVGTHP